MKEEIEEVMNQIRPALEADGGNVELVDVANRTSDHVPDALAALKAGKTVFLEKPIATCYTEAGKLKTAVARSKGKLYIRHNRRFEAAYQHIREIIASGILGKVYEIKLRRNSFSPRAFSNARIWAEIVGCASISFSQAAAMVPSFATTQK